MSKEELIRFPYCIVILDENPAGGLLTVSSSCGVIEAVSSYEAEGKINVLARKFFPNKRTNINIGRKIPDCIINDVNAADLKVTKE